MDASPASSQPQQSSAANQPSSTGPQIRSRITVVCAECKRLKLKCDRRAPCGSCTKRGTVERCIYSPAAAEKVDLHSLNNRLIQVEATLALVTSGQNPPAFQSTYPLAHLANASFSSLTQGSHQHHHHYAVPTPRNACISLSHQDLSLWFEELDLGISLPSSSSSCASSSRQHNAPLAGPSGYIKLEPSSFEIELTHPRSTTVNSIAIDMDESQTLSGNTPKPSLTSPTSSPLNPNAYLRNPAHQQFQSPSQLQKQQRYSAQLLLPALSIYYPVPSITLPGTSPLSASTFPSSSTIRTSPPTPPPSASASSSPYTFPTHSQPPQYSKPQITPALVALLPPLLTCKQFLNCAKEIFHVRPVPFEPGSGWVGFEKRCISLLSGGYLGKRERERDKAKEREERAREAKRARQIYFAGIPNLQSVQQRNDTLDDSNGGGTSNSGSGGGRILDEGGVAGEEFSLAFFAVMCAVLAVGSSSSQGSSPSENPAFFFALSQQALGVWDTHASSSGIAEERERMDFLLASLISVVYLLLPGSSVSAVGEDEDQKGINVVYPLVGKIVNAARGMGLGRDGSGQQLKTRDGDVSASTCRARAGYQANKGKEAEREKLWEDWKLLMWWDIMFYDLFIADSLGHQPYMSSYTYTSKLPECASDRVMQAIQADPDNDGIDTEDEEMEPHRHDGMTMQQDNLDKNRYLPPINNGNNGINGVTAADEEAYFGARCRLTQLAQTIKHRMAYPECCCGYTLDQAVSLESEIRRWQWALAASIKPSSVSSGENALRHPPLPCGGDLSGHQGKSAASLISQIHSCELSLMANLLMLRVHAPLLRAPSLAPTSLPQHTKAGSSVSQLNAHAAESTVKAAQSIIRTAISLHTALGSLSSSITPSMLDFYSLEKMVLDSVVICANPGLSTKLFPSSSTWMFDTNALLEDVASGLNLLSELRVMTEPHRKIVDALGTKLSQQGTNLLKRKHDQVDMTFGNLSSGGVGDDGTLSGFDGSQYGNSVTQQQSKVIDLSTAFPSPVSSAPMSSGGIEQQPQHAQKHKKSDNGDLITSITNAASARLAAAAAERDKQKEKDKTGKTTKKSYPPVGIRVRVAKDGSIIRPQRAQDTTTEGQMQEPPPRSNADAVLAFQQQQKQKLQAMTPTQGSHTITGSQHSQTSSQTFSPASNTMNMIDEDLRTEDVNSQSMDLPLPFVSSSEQMDIQTMSRKDYGIHDTNSQRQRQSFGSTHMFDAQPQPLYEQSQSSFDPITNSSGGSADGMSYNQVSSPFSNGSGAISASSSPFTATSSGHPSTPTFPCHHSTPPLFGPPAPPPSTTSPANYYRGSSSFTSYATNSPTLQSSNLATLQQHGNGSGMPLMDMGMDPTMMPPPILESPLYDKSQHAMYDPKPSVVDNLSRHHHHHRQHHQHRQQHFQQQQPSYDDGGQNHRHMVPVIPPWSSPPPPQQQQQQSSMSAQNGQSFWNNGEGFKFYP